MKRFFLFLLILLLLALPALAENRVRDNAGLFTDAQVSAWEAEIEQIFDRDHFNVVLVTEDSIGPYEAWVYSTDMNDYGGFSYGEYSDSILLLLMVDDGADNRDFRIIVAGRGVTLFNPRILDFIENHFLPFLHEGDYSGAVHSFLRDVQLTLFEARPAETAVPGSWSSYRACSSC